MARYWIAIFAVAFSFTLALADPPVDPHVAAVNNLRSLGQGCLLYAAENKGYLPSLPSQILKYVPQLDVYRDPRLQDDRHAGDPSKVADADKAGWVDKFSGFKLTVAPNTRMPQINKVTSTPLWVSKLDDSTGELLICFADGHVEAFGPKPLPKAPPAAAPATQPMR